MPWGTKVFGFGAKQPPSYPVLPTADAFEASVANAVRHHCANEGISASELDQFLSQIHTLYSITAAPLRPYPPLRANASPGLVAKVNALHELLRDPNPFLAAMYEALVQSLLVFIRAHQPPVSPFALEASPEESNAIAAQWRKPVWDFYQLYQGIIGDSEVAYLTFFRVLAARHRPMVQFKIPEETRFQHQWVVAPTGSGKTQLLQSQLVGEIFGDDAFVIMDSQGFGEGRLLSNIQWLKQFAPGQSHEGQLVVLMPNPDAPLSLNLFDMGQNDPSLSERERQMMYASAMKMISFCLGGTTDQQQDMIEYLVQLGLQIDGATIDTVRRMLQLPKATFFEEYDSDLEQADEVVRDYFKYSFHAQSMNVTREAVTRRIMGMLKNPTFRKMFQAKKNSFDMKKELDAGKIILISTDIALMGEAACELFGRYFISLLLLATQQRRSNIPVHVYIDECQDYIANDENVASLLDKARKQRVSFTFAHQRLANIKSPNVLDALSNCAIKFAGGNVTDASTLAKYMRTTPEFIADQKPLSFAAYIRGQTPSAVELKVQYGVMEKMERTTPEEHKAIWDDLLARYYSQPVAREEPIIEEEAPPTKDGWNDVI